jgi:SAM-dependent methyltransferase
MVLSMSNANEVQGTYWEDRASDWIAGLRGAERMSASFGALAMEQLSLGDGHRVLDIGCGSGPTTVELARRVGPDGLAQGIDIAPTMIAAARELAIGTGTTNAAFAVADAQVEPFEPGGFDAAYSRFGVMFFDDPLRAFSNIRSAVRPDGQFAFACWQNIFANEWMLVPGSAVVSVTGSLPPMPEPGEPGPFSLAEPGRVESLLAEAGFSSIEVTPRSEVVVLRDEMIEAYLMMSRGIGPVREALAVADAEMAGRIEVAVRDAILERVDDGVVRLDAAAFIVSARA